MPSSTPFTLCYRNEVDRATLTSTGVSDMDNLKDRRLSVKSTASSILVSRHIATWSDVDKATLGCIALLDMDFSVDPASAVISLTYKPSSSGGTTTITPPGGVVAPVGGFAGSGFPTNLIILFDEVEAYSITLQITLSNHTPIAGRFWSGPTWKPTTSSSKLETFRQQIRDPSTPQSSRGNSWKSDNLRRFRRSSVELPALTDDEVLGTDAGAVGLQDVLFEIGSSQECIIIPTSRSNFVVHKLGVYGHLEEDPTLELFNYNTSDGYLWRCGFVHTEEN